MAGMNVMELRPGTDDLEAADRLAINLEYLDSLLVWMSMDRGIEEASDFQNLEPRIQASLLSMVSGLAFEAKELSLFLARGRSFPGGSHSQ